jgi:hypothetical protein|tara:strand:+ start:45 stop:278 length:234 start_codon:yes stop_codon:yes gene_type:complete
MSNNININTIKDWSTFIIAVIMSVAGIIFWVQNINDSKFEEIEKEIQFLRDDINQIRVDNHEILRIVGRLEGKMENN